MLVSKMVDALFRQECINQDRKLVENVLYKLYTKRLGFWLKNRYGAGKTTKKQIQKLAQVNGTQICCICLTIVWGHVSRVLKC